MFKGLKAAHAGPLIALISSEVAEIEIQLVSCIFITIFAYQLQ